MKSTDSAGPFVLVADDDEAVRATVSDRLRIDGYHVVEASGGSEAIEIVRRGASVAVAILDIQMPDADGFEVLSFLLGRESPPRVIFLSAASEIENRLRALHGGAVDFVAKPFDPDEIAARAKVAFRQRAEVEEAVRSSRTDGLTGLANRRSFDHSLRAETARATRYGHPLSLLMFDVDGLKAVNDNFGHAAGDALLQAVSRAIRNTVRDTDRSSRIGGDEFACILPETDEGKARRFVARLRRAVESERFDAAGVTLSPSISIGMAILPEGGDPEVLKRAADDSLYSEKRARGTFR